METSSKRFIRATDVTLGLAWVAGRRPVFGQKDFVLYIRRTKTLEHRHRCIRDTATIDRLGGKVISFRNPKHHLGYPNRSDASIQSVESVLKGSSIDHAATQTIVLSRLDFWLGDATSRSWLKMYSLLIVKIGCRSRR